MGTPCPVDYTLGLISGKWKILIFCTLLEEKKRFGEILSGLGGISPKVLAQQLREMETSGLVLRTSYPEVPPRVEYALTDTGKRLLPILLALKEWGLSHAPEGELDAAHSAAACCRGCTECESPCAEAEGAGQQKR